MPASLRLPLGLLSWLLCLSSVAAIPSTAFAQADSFATHFHRDDNIVIVVEDPLPHLKTFLNSQALLQAFRTGPLGKLFSNDEQATDPAEAWQWVNTNRRWIPEQIAIGTSDAGVSSFDHMLRMLALFELLQAGLEGDAQDVNLQKEIKQLRKAIADELPLVQLPNLRIFVRFRDKEDAAALLEMLKLQIGDLEPADLPPGITFQSKETEIVARLSVREMLGAQEMDAATVLSGMGVVDLNDDPAIVKKASEATENFKAEMSLQLVGTSLLLTVGPTTAGGPAGLPASFSNLPPAVGKPDASTLFWGRWSATRLKAAAAAWTALREQWSRSTAFKLTHDGNAPADQPVLEIMQDLVLQMRGMADAGSIRVWSDARESAVRLAMVQEPTAAAAELSKSALVNLLPADAEGFTASTTTSLAEFVSDYLMQIEGRLATQSLKEQIAGGNGAVQLEDGYYSHFAALREMVHRTSMDRFTDGYALIYGTKGKVDRLEASIEIDAVPQRFSGRNLPTPELALIGKMKGDEAAARQHLDRAYSAFVTGIRSATRSEANANKPLPPIDIKSVTKDVGLGRQTWGFDMAALSAATGEGKLRIDAEGDLQPHYFFVDGLVVFSTSPRLSKSILAARDGKTKRLALPAEDEGVIVEIGRYSGESLGKTLEHLKAWVTTLSGQGNGVDEAANPAPSPFDVLANVSRMMKTLEWTTLQPANERRQVTTGVIIFGPPPEK